AVPELETTLPSNAVGKDFRAYPYVGLTDSGTGIEASLWGLLGVKFGWVEGVEVNVLGLVAGLDLRYPAVKLPGFGRVGVDDGTTVAVARAKCPFSSVAAAMRREAQKEPVLTRERARAHHRRRPGSYPHAILCASRASRHDARHKLCESAS